MFFGQSVRLSRLLATHPPLEERIRRIDPRFLAEQYRARRGASPKEAAAPEPERYGRRTSDLGVAWPRSAAQSAALVGSLEAGKVDHASRLLATLPAELREALREPERAAAAVAALLAAGEDEVFERQLAALTPAGLAGMIEPVRAAARLTRGLPEAFHLPVVDLALPALKSAAEETKKALVAGVQALAYADRRVSLHEFVLLTLLRYQLAPRVKAAQGGKRLRDIEREADVLVAVMAHAGTRADASGARASALDRALGAGARELGIDVMGTHKATLSLEAVSGALEAARALAPLEKARLVMGLFAAVTADGVIRVGEAELMRLVGAVLDCPLPPLIDEIDPATLAA